MLIYQTYLNTIPFNFSSGSCVVFILTITVSIIERTNDQRATYKNGSDTLNNGIVAVLCTHINSAENKTPPIKPTKAPVPVARFHKTPKIIIARLGPWKNDNNGCAKSYRLSKPVANCAT